MRLSWLCLCVLAIGACGDRRDQQMRDSLAYAQAELHRAQIEPLAGARLRNALEISQSPVDYLVAGTPDGSAYGPFRWQAPQQPFDVVISGQWDDWQLDGYAESLETPALTVHVVKE